MSRIVGVAFTAAVCGTALLLSLPAIADLDLPRPSPSAKVSQVVGLTEVAVEYSSPAVKGRKIWGDLVPYDKMWRTGANQATKISFSKDVVFAGKPVPAGSYALFTIPTKGEWTVILNKKADQTGTGRDYKADSDLLRVQLPTKAAPFRERMTFVFADFTDDEVALNLEWERLRLSIPIKVHTAEQALANIAASIDGTWRTYASAARYMLDTKKDYNTGLKYIDQSLALKEDWLNLWIKASLLAAKGNYKDAYALAEKANQLGQKAEFFFFEADVKKALGDWKKKL
jgi:hypothetical protein